MKQTDANSPPHWGQDSEARRARSSLDNASWNSSQQLPTWSPAYLYKQGDKVIWNGNIYESLGNNENEQPDSAEEGTNAPWRIIGPVL